MKLFKLWVHQKGFSEDELVINPKEFPDVDIGDILEIYHPDEDNSHLLLQVKSLQTDLQQKGKDIISVDQTIANLFQLRAYKDVEVHPINSVEDVSLDLVELVFKDQYISRSDMWRLKNSLIGSCAYLSKKVEHTGTRAQVNELWARGEKVMCGAVTEDTRVAFRSSTAMVYMFIQMSSEMWEFDSNGDLLWEKAVNGFVSDLFNHWKEKNTLNEVTIFLFSRIFYRTSTVDQFPLEMQHHLHTDYQGRIYEDFYRVIVQNERRDDWTPLLITLKSHCIEYGQKLQHHSALNGHVGPRSSAECQPLDGYISNAAEGNFLEALNLTLNVFDKHYINRNFDRTGQVVVIVTPGAGVFDVDRELYKLTKKRMIDNGIGSDLICMAEQPLHAVPLFRFHSTNRHQPVRDYNIPHWLNYSFYTAKGQLQKCCIHSSFTPRIKLAERKDSDGAPSIPHLPPLPVKWSRNRFQKSRQDDDYVFGEYDEEVFKAPSYASPKARTPFSMRPARSSHNSILSHRHRVPDDAAVQPAKKFKDRKKLSNIESNTESADSTNGQPTASQSTSSTAIPIPVPTNLVAPSVAVTAATRLIQETSISRSVTGGMNTEGITRGTPPDYSDGIVGSASAIHDRISSSPHHQFVYRTLINPFTPSIVAIRITSNRRRWTHTFPPGPSGEAVQPHHRRLTVSEEGANTGHLTSHTPASLSESISAPAHPYPPRPPVSPARQRLAPPGPALPDPAGGVQRSGSGSSLASDGSASGNPTHQNGLLRHPTMHRQNSSLLELSGGLRTSPISDAFRTLSRSISGLWGVTGEQEWSPYIKTGMDWKSLTATACFPITTDFYPDTQTVDRQFMENNYELLADEHDDDSAAAITGGKRKTGEGVLQEIIAQRLMQGFQLVVVPKSHLTLVQGRRSKDILVTDVNKHEYVLSIGRIFHKLVLDPQQRAISVTVYKPRHLNISRSVYYTYQLWSAHSAGYQPCSIGFQHSALENFNWNYLDNYVASKGIDFGPMESLKLWRSRFVLLPSVCSKMKRVLEDPAARLDIFPERSGPDECHPLIEGFLKFVETLNRLRRHHSGGRKSKTGSFSISVGNAKAGDRRRHSLAVVHSHARKSSDGMNSKTLISMVSSLTPNRQQTAASGLSPASVTTPSQGGGGGGVGAATDAVTTPPSRSLREEGEEAESGREGATEEERPRLTLWSTLREIAMAMRKEYRGGTLFLPADHRRIPTHCFVAAEGVQWVLANLHGDVNPEEAVELLQNMTSEGLIRHASGNPHHPFWNGFYLYCLVEDDLYMREKSKRSPTAAGHHGNLGSAATGARAAASGGFRNKWFEIAVCRHPATAGRAQAGVPAFLRPDPPRPASPATVIMSSAAESLDGGSSTDDPDDIEEIRPSMLHATRKPASLKSLLFDNYTTKTDRVEWCHITYDGCFCPDTAWGFQVEWLVSTPSLLVEVLQGWARKAVQCGFHLIPAPMDPFNQCPHFSNPLARPRFVPLALGPLRSASGRPGLLSLDSDPGTRARRVCLLQEAILKRFGFIQAIEPLPPSPVASPHSVHGQTQYVHTTGMALALVHPRVADLDTPSWQATTPLTTPATTPVTTRVTTPASTPTSTPNTAPPGLRPDLAGGEAAPGGGGSPGQPAPPEPQAAAPEAGFWWAPNYLLTKRWRTSSCGDERLPERLLRDFAHFCRDGDGRLTQFWEACCRRATPEATPTPESDQHQAKDGLNQG